MKKYLMAGVSAAVLAAAMGPAEALTDDYAAFLGRVAAEGYALHRKDGEPTMAEVNTAIETLGSTFEEFKKTNDERIAELTKNGAVTPELQAKFDKVEKDLSEVQGLKESLDKLQARLNRPGGGGGDGDPLADVKRRHADAFVGWMRNPDDHDRRSALKTVQGEAVELKAVTIGTDAAGGYAVPEVISQAIHEKLVDISPMRADANVVAAGTSDYKELVDVGGEAYGWVGEGDTRSETGTPQLEEVAPSFGIVYAYPKASEESLQDIFFDVENWLTNRSSRGIAKGEGIAFVSGDGTKKPTGFLNGTPVTTGDEDSPARAFGTPQYFATGKADGFDNSRLDSPPGDPGDVFSQVVYGLKAGYRGNAKWRMNKGTAGTIRRLKDADGDYLWQPGLIAGEPATLLGYSISEDEAMPAIAANAFPVAFGDWMEAYLIVDLAGLRITRDEITTPGYVKFYVRKRVGGKLLNDDAIKLIKVAAS